MTFCTFSLQNEKKKEKVTIKTNQYAKENKRQ